MGTPIAPSTAVDVGRAFAQAYAAGDRVEVARLLHPSVREREIVPGAVIEQQGPDAVVQEVSEFIAAHGEPETLELRVEALGPLVSWSTRWRMGRGAAAPIVEWHAFLTVQDGLVSRIDAVCSGLVPET